MSSRASSRAPGDARMHEVHERAAPKGADEPAALHVALVAPEIAWNTGNVGRTALAAGARLHLVRPLGFRLDRRHVDRRVKRAGLDYWPHVEPSIWPSVTAFEAKLPELGEPYFFSAEAERDFWTADLTPGVVLVFGGETAGLPPDLRRRHQDRMLRIPMVDGPVRSLNLSNAVAVALYEAKRQRS